jgi:outer membrane protein assembly factor BamB
MSRSLVIDHAKVGPTKSGKPSIVMVSDRKPRRTSANKYSPSLPEIIAWMAPPVRTAVTDKELWKRHWPTPLIAGVTLSAGGVLFSGDMDNNFLALDARTGKTLYTFNAGGSVRGGVISYEVNGSSMWQPPPDRCPASSAVAARPLRSLSRCRN